MAPEQRGEHLIFLAVQKRDNNTCGYPLTAVGKEQNKRNPPVKVLIMSDGSNRSHTMTPETTQP